MKKKETKKTNLNAVRENKQKKTTNSTSKKTAPKKTVAPKTTAPKKTAPKKTVAPKTTAPKKTVAPKDEFRKNKDTAHPSYIYEKVGRKYVYIGMTHSPITNNVMNIKLEKNPNPNDKKDAYFRPKAGVSTSDRFKKKEQGWKLSKEDKKKADIIAKNTSSKK